MSAENKMSLGQFNALMKKHNIPDDATIMSDSGWECSESDCGGVFYSTSANTIILTRKYKIGDKYSYGSVNLHDPECPKYSDYKELT